MSLFPRQGQGLYADLMVGGYHLRLFCTESGVGLRAEVFDVKTGQWVCRAWADDIENSKARAEQLAREYLSDEVPSSTPFPTLEWKDAG